LCRYKRQPARNLSDLYAGKNVTHRYNKIAPLGASGLSEMMASDEDLLDVETKRLRAIMFGMLIISAVCALGLLIDLFVEL
jgi:hypothetical protein